MATMKKAQAGKKVVKKPTYKNLRMGVANASKVEGRDYTEKATKQDSINYNRGFARGLKKDKDSRLDLDEVEKAGRWEGLNTKKSGGPVKKAQAGARIKMTSTKDSDTKKTTYPGGATKTETKFKNATAFKKSKAKSGGSFPDLNKDGKITKADILKGRGVIAKKGATIKKAFLGKMLGGMGISKIAGAGGFGNLGKAFGMKSGGAVKKKAQNGYQTNPAKSKLVKAKSKFVDSPIKTPKGKDINAFQGKKGMLAKSGTSMKKCKYGCK